LGVELVLSGFDSCSGLASLPGFTGAVLAAVVTAVVTLVVAIVDVETVGVPV
jgi:hypothetical protein